MISSDERELHQLLETLSPMDRTVALAAAVIDSDPRAAQQISALVALAEVMATHLGVHDRLAIASLFIDSARALVVTSWH